MFGVYLHVVPNCKECLSTLQIFPLPLITNLSQLDRLYLADKQLHQKLLYLYFILQHLDSHHFFFRQRYRVERCTDVVVFSAIMSFPLWLNRCLMIPSVFLEKWFFHSKRSSLPCPNVCGFLQTMKHQKVFPYQNLNSPEKYCIYTFSDIYSTTSLSSKLFLCLLSVLQ